MQNISKDIVKEGKVKILLKSKNIKESKFQVKDVFYNPVQIYNRDLSLLVT